ncbi:hypothetical protein SNEBB_000112 [Seison nebaliae]|nr:hypothetical protein SNEBB_000112 [Seison nebaliae]
MNIILKMAFLGNNAIKLSSYYDTQFKGSEDQLKNKLSQSRTLYVGNMSFYTTEEQIYERFSLCGELNRIIMGIDRNTKTPCGFCFLEYVTREGAETARRYINLTHLDNRRIRIDWDAGFVEGRQYGRGRHGGQVRDEYRTNYDEDRGGFGKNMLQQIGNFDSEIQTGRYV